MRIDDMPAGRQLDMLVAEHVMGRRWVKTTWKPSTGKELHCRSLETQENIQTYHIPLATMQEPICPGMLVKDEGLNSDLHLPFYSTRMWRAEEVLLHLIAGPSCEVNIKLLSGYAEVSIRNPKMDTFTSDDSTYGEAPSLPLAICRAAVKRVGVEEVPDEASG